MNFFNKWDSYSKERNLEIIHTRDRNKILNFTRNSYTSQNNPIHHRITLCITTKSWASSENLTHHKIMLYWWQQVLNTYVSTHILTRFLTYLWILYITKNDKEFYTSQIHLVHHEYILYITGESYTSQVNLIRHKCILYITSSSCISQVNLIHHKWILYITKNLLFSMN